MSGTVSGISVQRYGSGTMVPPSDSCPLCSTNAAWVIHGGPCPKVEEIEYYPNGGIKRVRYRKPEPEITIALPPVQASMQLGGSKEINNDGTR